MHHEENVEERVHVSTAITTQRTCFKHVSTAITTQQAPVSRHASTAITTQRTCFKVLSRIFSFVTSHALPCCLLIVSVLFWTYDAI